MRSFMISLITEYYEYWRGHMKEGQVGAVYDMYVGNIKAGVF